ncbi:MAG: hypothetical protein ACE5IP_02305 [Terriglobia bacterium]
MSTSPQQPAEDTHLPPGSASAPRWLVVLLVVLSALLIYVAFMQRRMRADLVAQLEQTNGMIDRLASRASTLEDNYADLKGQSDVTSKRLGLTRRELQRARAAAKEIKEEQRRAAEQLSSQIAEQQSQLGSLEGTVGEVRGEVTETRQELEQTQLNLQRTIGDLGLQSGLIARNKDELEELRRRGERDYHEFDIRKSKRYTRVGDIAIRLNKTDRKRQKYTLTLLANDKRIEKKDKTLLEPVQFYMQGTRHLLEIVVYEVNKNRIVGYLSVPKQVAARSSSSKTN